MMSNTKRIPAFDVAKGIGILCVILGHLGWWDAIRAVYPFHMPLFFIISGWFISTNKLPKEYLLNRVRSFAKAYVFTSICLILLTGVESVALGNSLEVVLMNIWDVFVQSVYGSGAIENKTLFSIGPIGAIWFLPSLVWATSLVQFVVSKKTDLWEQVLIIIMVFIICWLSSKLIFLPFEIQTGGCAAFYVYIGWITKESIRNNRIPEVLKKYQKRIIPIGFFAWLYDFYLEIFPNIACLSFPYFGISILMAIPISFALIKISHYISIIKLLGSFLETTGRLSLPILCFHLIELRIFPWNLLYSELTILGVSFILQYWIVFTLKVTVCVGFSLLSTKFESLKQIFNITYSI